MKLLLYNITAVPILVVVWFTTESVFYLLANSKYNNTDMLFMNLYFFVFCYTVAPEIQSDTQSKMVA